MIVESSSACCLRNGKVLSHAVQINWMRTITIIKIQNTACVPGTIFSENGREGASVLS